MLRGVLGHLAYDVERMAETERLEVEELRSLHEPPGARVSQVLDPQGGGGAELGDDRTVRSDDANAADSGRVLIVDSVAHVDASFLHVAETKRSRDCKYN